MSEQAVVVDLGRLRSFLTQPKFPLAHRSRIDYLFALLESERVRANTAEHAAIAYKNIAVRAEKEIIALEVQIKTLAITKLQEPEQVSIEL